MIEKNSSETRIDAIGKTIATVIMAILAAMFLYAYFGHLLSR